MTIVATPLSEQAEKVLNHRYFLKDTEGEVIEDGDAMFRRVAKAIAAVDETYVLLPGEAELAEKDFYDIMSKLEFVPRLNVMATAASRVTVPTVRTITLSITVALGCSIS